MLNFKTAALVAAGVILMCGCQKKLSDMTREEGKAYCEAASIATLNKEVAKLTEAEKEKLVDAWLVTSEDITPEERAVIVKGCAGIIAHTKLGFYAELFATTPVGKHEAGGGAWAAGDHISMSTGLLDKRDPEVIRNTLTHELFHIFNHREKGAGGISALNEGTAIWIFTMTFYTDDEEKMFCGLAEPVIGTKLYYRDIGIPNYPTNIAFGVPTEITPKGKEVYDMLMEADPSHVPVYDEEKMKEFFAYFEDLNRNQDFKTYVAQFRERLENWLKKDAK